MRELIGMLFILFLLVGCGRHPVDSTPATPAKLGTISKSENTASSKGKIIPKGWVKIVNHITGQQIGYRRGNSPEEHEKSSYWRIEQSGEYYKILNQFSGEYLGLSEDSKQKDGGTSQMPDSKGASTFWKIESAGNECWRLLNRDTGKCLESRKNSTGKNVIRQSALRDGVLEQQWRFETVSVTPTARDNSKVVPSGQPTQPTEKTAAENESPAEDKTPHLDCEHLTVGDTGTIMPPCAYVEVLKIVDDWSAIVLPVEIVYGPSGSVMVDLADLPQVMNQQTPTPRLPLLLKGLPTQSKVTGEKLNVSGQIFRVTGTEDVKRSSGEVVRVHVLELVQ